MYKIVLRIVDVPQNSAIPFVGDIQSDTTCNGELDEGVGGVSEERASYAKYNLNGNSSTKFLEFWNYFENISNTWNFGS